MAAHAPQLPTNAGKIVSSYMATVGAAGGAGTVAYRFTYDSGWVYEYDPAGDLLRAYNNGPISSGSGGSTVSTSTGVNPTETSYSLYGHTVPLSVLGLARIGGEIISGPWVENGRATFCISFGYPADPHGTRTLREIAFDSEVVWTSADGFSAEGFTYRWYPGSLSQAADPVEIAHYGANAVAYRPQMLLWFENLPLANTKFKKIPYVAAVIADAEGDMVNLGNCFTRLATSPWVGYTSAQFETDGVTDACGGMIFAQDTEFLAAIQMFGRFYKSWDILQTDKLRIVDRGAVTTADINLDRTRLMSELSFGRAATDSVPRVLELSTIDPAADYTIVPSKAVRPLVPVTVTTSVSTDTVFLPVIMDSATRQSLVTYTKYQEEVARRRITGTAMMYGLEIEPGDLVAFLNLGDDFINEVFHVIETTHGANYVVEFVAESILRCSLVIDESTDPYFNYVVLLSSYEGLDGSTGLPGTVDDSPKHQTAPTCAGTAQIDTAQHKFGTSSMLFDNVPPTNTSSLNYSPTADWDFGAGGTGRFTIEAWIRPANVNVGNHFFLGKWGLDGFRCWALYLNGAQLGFARSPDGYTNYFEAQGGTVLANVWQAVCVDYDGTTTRVYLNGATVATTSVIRAIHTDTFRALTIGNVESGLGDSGYAGWVDEVRITNGIARYHSDSGYTPPTGPFPRTGP